MSEKFENEESILISGELEAAETADVEEVEEQRDRNMDLLLKGWRLLLEEEHDRDEKRERRHPQEPRT